MRETISTKDGKVLEVNKTKMKIYKLTLPCPECLEGLLETYTSSTWDIGNVRHSTYRHRCTICEFETVLEVSFPKMIYQEDK